MPVVDLLGGRADYGDRGFPLYRAISQDSPLSMASSVSRYVTEGYRKFQLKVGGDYREDIERIIAVRQELDNQARALKISNMPLMCDANTGWLRHEAMQVTIALSLTLLLLHSLSLG